MQIAYEVALQMLTDKYAFHQVGVYALLSAGVQNTGTICSQQRGQEHTKAVVAAAAAIPQHHFDFAVQQDRQKSHCLPTAHACKDACDVELR